jgi:hypothetical protein
MDGTWADRSGLSKGWRVPAIARGRADVDARHLARPLSGGRRDRRWRPQPRLPFLRQAPDRAFVQSGGIQEIVAGTGGKSHPQPVRQPANTVVQNADTYGVLRLVLRPLGWDWQFVPASGGGFTDVGSGDCH